MSGIHGEHIHEEHIHEEHGSDAHAPVAGPAPVAGHAPHGPAHGASGGEDVRTTTGDPNTRYMYRPGKILVAESDLGAAWKELTASGAEESEIDDRLHLRVFDVPNDAVPEVVDRLRCVTAGVSANVVLPLGWHISCPSPPQALKATHHLQDLPEASDEPTIRVGMIDTGVADHPYLRGRVERRPGKKDLDVLELEEGGTASHGFGHGTFAASQIVRHAPDAKVVARRAVGQNGTIDDLSLARALLDLGELQGDESVDVISLSMSGYTPGDRGLLATGEALRQLFDANRDLVVVVAAGNHGFTRVSYPGGYKQVIAVGAVDGSRERAYFSNYGHWVDACAEGVDVEGAFPHEESVLWPHTSEPRDYSSGFATWSGTSFTAPQVAGALAQKMAGGLSGRDAIFALLNGCQSVPDLGTWIA